MNSKKIGLYCASVHFLAAIAAVLYISRSTDPQASLLWGIFAILDFPVSLVYLAAPQYSAWLEAFQGFKWAQVVYLPHVVHVLLGTVWWYFLPRLVTPRRFGGVWG